MYDIKDVIERRVRRHPKDKYLLTLFHFKIAKYKITVYTGKGLIGFQGYFNKWNPLAWVLAFTKAFIEGASSFYYYFRSEWRRIVEMDGVTKFVDMSEQEEVEDE